MPAVKTVSEILAIAKVAQYHVHADVIKSVSLKGASLDPKLHLKIYMERRAIEWMYSKDPNDSLLQNNANYLYMMLGKYASIAEDIIGDAEQGTPPIVAGTDDESAMDGQLVTFSVEVTSELGYSVEWYKNGVVLSGTKGVSPVGEHTDRIEITFTATQADNGAAISAIATNQAGSTPSAVGHLTILSQLQGRYYFGDTDFFEDLEAEDISNIVWSGSFNVETGQPLVVPFPIEAANNKYLLIEYPDSETVKDTWFNTVLNNGQIPDQIFRPVIHIANKRYIISRVAASIDSTNTSVTFS